MYSNNITKNLYEKSKSFYKGKKIFITGHTGFKGALGFLPL